MSFVRIDHVTRRYRHEVTALDNVNLEIRSGEWIAIMGPSGSGKTTLMNLLGGLDVPEQGRVVVDGLDLTRLSRPDLIRYRRECVGLVFQQFHLIPYLTALENVMLAQYLHSLADEAEARLSLEAVGLSHRLHHLPSALSGGEKQRVCIARALINRPKLVLADEPTGNLHSSQGKEIMELFKKLNEQGTTIVQVTHSDVNASYGRRIVKLSDGWMVA